MPRRKRTAEEMLLDRAAALLRQRGGGAAVRRVVVETVGGKLVEVEADPFAPNRPSGLDQVKRAILDASAKAHGPLKGRAIARRAGVPFTGYFRTALSELVHVDKVLDIIPGEGYWPRGRPVPGDLFGSVRG